MLGEINHRPRNKNAKAFLVWRADPLDDETVDDARTVWASDPKEAAEDWAEWEDSNSADYIIIGGCDADVFVRLKSDDSAPVERFTVGGESVPKYSAKPHAEKT